MRFFRNTKGLRNGNKRNRANTAQIVILPELCEFGAALFSGTRLWTRCTRLKTGELWERDCD
jgi:hypothetical protein